MAPLGMPALARSLCRSRAGHPTLLYRAVSTSTNTGKPKLATRLEDGPSFSDFLSAPDPNDLDDDVSADANGYINGPSPIAAEEQLETVMIGPAGRQRPHHRLPSWLRQPVPTGKNYSQIKRDLRSLGLHTVCEEARCPNMSECWGGSDAEAGAGAGQGGGTATIMLMGDTCTRGCRFCAVKTSRTPPPLDPAEPARTAEALARWKLGYVVLTTVDRDDLVDGGAAHFADTISRIKVARPETRVEALTGDFDGKLDCVSQVARSGLDVYAHNIETTEQMTPFVRDRRASYRRTLAVLERAKQSKDGLVTKTSMMLGLGETEQGLWQALRDLRTAGVDIVTFGQYMRPTKRHMPVHEYVRPAAFDMWRERALSLGFLYCASGPLVRSSYRAGEFFIENVLRQREKAATEKTDDAVPTAGLAGSIATAAATPFPSPVDEVATAAA